MLHDAPYFEKGLLVIEDMLEEIEAQDRVGGAGVERHAGRRGNDVDCRAWADVDDDEL